VGPVFMPLSLVNVTLYLPDLELLVMRELLLEGRTTVAISTRAEQLMLSELLSASGSLVSYKIQTVMPLCCMATCGTCCYICCGVLSGLQVGVVVYKQQCNLLCTG
jgi:hypothetical protein